MSANFLLHNREEKLANRQRLRCAEQVAIGFSERQQRHVTDLHGASTPVQRGYFQ